MMPVGSAEDPEFRLEPVTAPAMGWTAPGSVVAEPATMSVESVAVEACPPEPVIAPGMA